jgi:O-antigen/teichoic acid export membrane protein
LKPGDEADDATRGSAIKLVADLGGRLLGAATPILIVRALSVPDLGLFQFASATAVIVAEMADLGLQAISVRDLVARHFGVGALLRIKALLTAATLAALAALPLLPPVGPLGSHEWLAVVGPLVVYFTLMGWNEQLGVVLRVRGRRVQEAATILAFRAALLAAVAVGVAGGGGLLRLVWAHVVATVPVLALAWWLVARSDSPADAAAPGIRAGALLRRALPLGVNGLLSLLSLRIELLALGIWATTVEAGLYSASLQIFLFLIVVPAAICAGAMPALTREALRGSGPVRERTAMTLAALAAPAAAGLILVPDVLVVLFGARYGGATLTLRVLALGLPVVFMNALLLHALIAAGRAAHVARLTAVRTAVAAVAAAVLVARAGAVGAAAGFVAAELTLLALAARACIDAGFRVPIVGPLGWGVALSTPMAIVLGLVHVPPLAKVAIGVAVYALTLAVALRVRPRLWTFSTADSG